jgi:mRNA interferase HigB
MNESEPSAARVAICYQNGKLIDSPRMLITGKPVIDEYMVRRRGQRGLGAAARQFDTWWAEVSLGQWRNPAELKRMYATASLVRGGRVVFNISGNNYRLVARMNYRAQVVDIRFFGTHMEYDRVNVADI